jgi:hypothetical protein
MRSWDGLGQCKGRQLGCWAVGLDIMRNCNAETLCVKVPWMGDWVDGRDRRLKKCIKRNRSRTGQTDGTHTHIRTINFGQGARNNSGDAVRGDVKEMLE